jgi:hypothetical protein
LATLHRLNLKVDAAGKISHERTQRFGFVVTVHGPAGLGDGDWPGDDVRQEGLVAVIADAVVLLGAGLPRGRVAGEGAN